MLSRIIVSIKVPALAFVLRRFVTGVLTLNVLSVMLRQSTLYSVRLF